MIDDESILVNGGDDIIDFIEYIASRESGEFAGLSVGVYGEKIPVVRTRRIESGESSPINTRQSKEGIWRNGRI